MKDIDIGHWHIEEDGRLPRTHEISSLNLIIQFLLNELKPDFVPTSSDIDLSTLCVQSNKKGDHDVDWSNF